MPYERLAECLSLGLNTRLARGLWRPEEDRASGSIVPPIFVSAVYRYPDAWEKSYKPRVGDLKYSRENNPSVMILEDLIACIEQGEWALVFNSGMSAIAAILLAYSSREARITLARLVYGSTRSLTAGLWRRIGFEYRLAGPPWEDLLEEAESSDLVLVETIGNPTLRIPPLRELARICLKSGCRLVVDNTFASPVLYRPLDDGAWLSVESMTKYMAGHNDVMGGSISGKGEDVLAKLWDWRRAIGATLQPIEAYLTLRGLKTLGLRVERASKTTMELAEWLEADPRIARVYYPGLPSHPDHSEARRLFNGGYGGVVSFELKSCTAATFLDNLRLISPAPSLGGVESLASVPYYSSHRNLPEDEKKALGITPGLIRLSVGLEDVDDLKNDIKRALESC